MGPISLEDVRARVGANRDVLRKLKVRELSVFGSVVRGEASADSDLDFLVDFEKKTFDAYMDLKEFLEDLFDRPVDLVLRDALKPALKEAILREAVHAT